MKKQIVILISMVILLLAACNNGNVSSSTSKNEGDPLTDVIMERLQSEYQNISKFEIGHVVDYEETHKFVGFTFLEGNKEYEGISYLTNQNGKLSLQEVDVAQINKDVPFTNHGLTSSLVLNDNVQRSFHIVSGHLNDSKIKELMINFKNQKNVSLRLNEDQKIFMYVTVGQGESPQEIQGLDKDRNLISSVN